MSTQQALMAYTGGDNISLPENPSSLATAEIVEACRRIFEHRIAIVDGTTLDAATEGLRRAKAIEQYVSAKEHKDDARRAARILETAVGEALGVADLGRPTNNLPREVNLIAHQDRYRFRRLAEHRAIWWPALDEKALSRKQALRLIDDALRPQPNGAGEALISHESAEQWLNNIELSDLLLTDPPYSTDVEDIATFVRAWLPLALSKLKPTGRAFIFVGAYANELAAYFSHPLPNGWAWGVPHAWCYRNTIGPTPEYDFVRNWQCMVTAYGPDAGPLHTDRITELLAGFVENAPDGRQETKHHKWQKPLPLIERLIRVATNPNDIVIDPFAGSGTTLLAAKELGRIGLGCDADREAVETCLTRGCDAA